jgi:hypothetical protein
MADPIVAAILRHWRSAGFSTLTPETSDTLRQRRCSPSVASSKENQEMALRSKTMTKGPDPEEPAQELFSQRRRPETGQFLLQVDRQTKASFSTYEAAEAAGLVIKKNFPVVRVAIYDSVTCVNKIIEPAKA